MNEMQVFHNENFGRVRGFRDDGGNSWFVAADVCLALGLTDTSKTVSLLDDDEKGTNTIRTLGGQQELLIISEPGLYSLILRSRKPGARAFKRWITHEVIPAIRKTGRYETAAEKSTAAPDFEPRGDRLDNDANLRCHVATLRLMARQPIYPVFMRLLFLAEAASLMRGLPSQSYLPFGLDEPIEPAWEGGGNMKINPESWPPEEETDFWEKSGEIGRRYGLPGMAVARILKTLGLHGSQDAGHTWSCPISSDKGVPSYVYMFKAIQPHLEKYLADRNGVLFN